MVNDPDFIKPTDAGRGYISDVTERELPRPRPKRKKRATA